MNPIDVAFLAIMGYGLWRATSPTFLATITNAIKWFFSIGAALLLTGKAIHIIERLARVPAINRYLPFLTFIGLAIGIYFTLTSIGISLGASSKSKNSFGFGVNMFGSSLWLLSLLFGFSMVMAWADYGYLLSDNLRQTSWAYHYFQPIASILYCKMEGLLPAIQLIAESFTKLLYDTLYAVVDQCYDWGGATSPPAEQLPPTTQ